MKEILIHLVNYALYTLSNVGVELFKSLLQEAAQVDGRNKVMCTPNRSI